MNFIEFTYTKADGTESKRAVLPLVGPTTFVEGIDVSQMPEDEFVVFCRDFSNSSHVLTYYRKVRRKGVRPKDHVGIVTTHLINHL